MSKRETIKATGQGGFKLLSEVMQATGHEQFFIKGMMKNQISFDTSFTSLLATRLCIACIEFTNKEKGYAYPDQKHLMQLIGASSEESVRQVTRIAENLGWLRSEPVYENGKCKGVRYFMAWERWNERSMAKHANDNSPRPEMGTPPAINGDTPSQSGGNNTYKYNLEDKRDSLFADSPRESRDSRATSKCEATTALAVGTGMDLADSFLSVFPLAEYIEDQSSRNEPPDENEIWRLTDIQLRKKIREGLSFETLMAGAMRYRMFAEIEPEFLLSPQKWLGGDRLYDLTGYEDIDRSIIERAGEGGIADSLVRFAHERKYERTEPLDEAVYF